jgi:hypothetical protein
MIVIDQFNKKFILLLFAIRFLPIRDVILLE